MTREEMEELKGLAASMGLYDDRKPCKRAVILGKAIKALEQEPCIDSISRREAIHVISACDGKSAQIEALEQLPPVTPQPKTGYWISWYEIIEEEWGTEHNPHCKCSECSTEVDPHISQSINCCPVCGAKMVGYRKSEVKK